MTARIDLGDGHWAYPVKARQHPWKVGMTASPCPDPDECGCPHLVEVGFILAHDKRPDDEACRHLDACEGAIWYACAPGSDRRRERPVWTLVSRDPLHLEPSVACHCGDHGFIRDGKWVRA